MMKFACVFFALFAATFLGLGKSVTTNDALLWRPRFATPALVALDNNSNRQFLAEVKASAKAKNWSATLANDLKIWPGKILSAKYSKINRGTEPGWQVQISVPADISPELFTLTISNSESVSSQKQSVSVVPAFETNFYILHISDEQIVNQYHTDPSGQYYKMVGTWEEIKWMQEPINLINPRFVLVTGDQIDFNGALDGWNNWSNWGYKPPKKKLFTEVETKEIETRLSEMYHDCHKGYRVAYVETPGNHDVAPIGKRLEGSEIDWHPISANMYEKWFGQRTWSFRMGDFYVLMHDWSDPDLKTWAAKDFESAFNDPTIKYRIVGQHFHAAWDGAPKGNAAFRPESCDLMLIGHGHVTTTIQTSPYYIYEDGPTFKYGTSGFFNFRRTSNGWSCDQTVSHRNVTNDVWHLFTDNGVTKLVRADQPDTMNITTNAVTITNDLPQNFYDGRVRFVLTKGNYHSVKNGQILAQYECADNQRTAVLVKVNIRAKATVSVSVPSEPIQAQ
jgi:Calcineurin-like phosphoesterase